MNILALLITGCIVSFSIIWLINYIPLARKNLLGNLYSPRLIACKFLILLDIVLTLILIVGPMALGIHGVHSFVVGALSGFFLSIGIYITRKLFVPKWQREFESKKAWA